MHVYVPRCSYVDIGCKFKNLHCERATNRDYSSVSHILDLMFLLNLVASNNWSNCMLEVCCFALRKECLLSILACGLLDKLLAEFFWAVRLNFSFQWMIIAIFSYHCLILGFAYLSVIRNIKLGRVMKSLAYKSLWTLKSNWKQNINLYLLVEHQSVLDQFQSV